MTSASSSVNKSIVVEPHYLRNHQNHGNINRAAKKQFSYIQACKQSHNQSRGQGGSGVGSSEENANRGESHGYRDSEKQERQRSTNFIYVSTESVDSASYREKDVVIED